VLDAALHCLACPLCEAPLVRHGGTLCCEAGHSFDIARQGYASLIPGDAYTGTADTAAMLEAREAFFAAGRFDPIVRAVAERASALLASGGAGCVVDVGAGPGRYLAAVLDAAPGRAGVALDLSKHAARRAARAHPRVAAAVADTWGRLPVATGAAALVLDVFAPRNAAEFRRLLAPDGALVVVTPTARHLREAVEALGLLAVDEDKGERLAGQLEADFTAEDEAVLITAASSKAPGRSCSMTAPSRSRRAATLDLDRLRQRPLVGEPLLGEVAAVGDLLDGQSHVLAARLDRDRAVIEQDLPGAFEEAAVVFGDAADGGDVAVERDGPPVPHAEFYRHPPRAGVGDADRPADRLVEDRGRDAAVEAVGIALVFGTRREDAGELASIQLEEPRVQAGGVLGTAHVAHAADVLRGKHSVLHEGSSDCPDCPACS